MNPLIIDGETLDKVIERLREYAADRVPHSAWSLHQHLVGTAGILQAWSQPSSLVLAGLLHSVYSTEIFREQTVPLDDRAGLRALVGAEAESFAYLFCAVHRDDLFSAARDGRAAAIACRWDGEVRLTRHQIGSLVILHMANLAEQACADDLSPTRWLSRFSRLGLMAGESGVVPPRVFNGCAIVIDESDEDRLVSWYRDALKSPERAFSKPGEDVIPSVGRHLAEPVALQALVELATGNATLAQRHAEHALDIAASWGTSWDKRLSLLQWGRIIQFTRRAAILESNVAQFYGAAALRVMERSNGSPSAVYAVLDDVGAFPPELQSVETPWPSRPSLQTAAAAKR